MNSLSAFFADENLFRSIVEASPAGMLLADAEGQICMANRAAGEQFGYSVDELMKISVDELIPETDRPTHQAHRARYMAHPEHRPMAAGRNLFGMRKDGSTFPVDISLHPITVAGQQMVLANVLDATDRRLAEQEREQRQAMERLALMGQLAGGVAHEIRTPLCVIRNDAYFLKMMMPDLLGQEGIECIDEINVAVRKAERIVGELLDFTRDPPSEPVDVSVSELIQRATRAMTIPEGIQLRESGSGFDTQVHVDIEQIERVLVNLFRNAVQAMSESGQIELTVQRETNHAVLSVIDNGPGIPTDELERVFEPLFTTKSKGIGLGLAVSRRYVRRNGGTLVAFNADSRGAGFRLTLPLAPKTIETGAIETKSNELAERP